MNAILALTVGGPGLIGAAPGLKDEAIATAIEGVDVAAALGVEADRDWISDMINKVTRVHLWHHTSMRVDIEGAGRTKIDGLNGYASAKGWKLGVPTPKNDLLAAMIRAREL